MKIFEIDTPINNPIELPAINEPVAVDEPLIPAINEPIRPQYANNSQINNIIKQLTEIIPNGSFTLNGAGGIKSIPHIRIQKISVTELKNAITLLGGTLGGPDLIQSRMSGKFPVYAFNIDGIDYTAVIGSVKGHENNDIIGIGRKELSPTALGLAGKSYNKADLIKHTKAAVIKHIRDPKLQEALITLVDIASTGGVAHLPTELAQYIAPNIGTISQDFGEILAPILIMDADDQAELPAGNNPIVDVKLKNMNLSVKALTGSGTSFRTISDLMDKYENSITDDARKEKFEVLKSFHPGQGGKNVDKIVRAAATAKTKEYLKLADILKEQFTNYSELTRAVTNKIMSTASTLDYQEFLTLVYPAMIAGDWGVPTGLPADGKYYLKHTTLATKEKSAGKPSYDANPRKGATDILTYMLGVGLLNLVRRGGDREVYSSMMTDICKQADAVLGHITINPNGSIQLITRPFGELKFEFQYHAPSHIPGNNLPGFIAILD